MKTDPDSWQGEISSDLIKNVWGVEISSDYKYVRFYGKETGSSQYEWNSSKDIADKLVTIPVTEYSYPCFVGAKRNEPNFDQAPGNLFLILSPWEIKRFLFPRIFCSGKRYILWKC